VNFEKPVKDVYNLIRGCDPQPGAYTTYHGKRVRFYEARMSSATARQQSGEIVAIDEGSVQIAAKDGILQIGKLRVDKGEKIGPAEFAKLIGGKVGDRLGNK
jgi:methionyl-tRNA formyltransferase